MANVKLLNPSKNHFIYLFIFDTVDMYDLIKTSFFSLDMVFWVFKGRHTPTLWAPHLTKTSRYNEPLNVGHGCVTKLTNPNNISQIKKGLYIYMYYMLMVVVPCWWI